MALLVSLGVTASWDAAGLTAAETLRSPSWTMVMKWITVLGEGEVLGPLAAVVGIGLWLTRNKRQGQFYLGSVVIAYASYGILKWAFARPRPSVIPRLDGAGWYSFPSGHTMMSAVILGLAVMLITERRLARGAVGFLVAMIAFSRVYLGVHYPTDVIAGLLVGTAWMLGVTERLRGGSGPLLPGRESGTPRAGRTTGNAGGR